MIPDMQNPAVEGGASRNHSVGRLHSSPTASDWRAQMLASRFCLSPWMARQVCSLHFGESGHD